MNKMQRKIQVDVINTSMKISKINKMDSFIRNVFQSDFNCNISEDSE